MLRVTEHVAILWAGLLLFAYPAHASLISVIGPASSDGTFPAIVAAPADILDDIVINTGMEGFDEAQGVLTTVAHAIDGGGFIPVGSLVDSHMIFLNNEGSALLSHSGVIWTFSGPIIGIMSDSFGALEAASTFELGSPTTNYTVPFLGSGPAAPFTARGLEGADSYLVLDPFTLLVDMSVTEPGDWIRVVTAAPAVPEPATILLLGAGLAAAAYRRRAGRG